MADASRSAEMRDDRTWGILCHLSALAMLLGVPLGNLLGPLVVWLVKRDQSSFVDQQGREALNFQISITLYALVVFIGSTPGTKRIPFEVAYS